MLVQLGIGIMVEHLQESGEADLGIEDEMKRVQRAGVRRGINLDAAIRAG
jgi:hypothetical protein